MKPTHFIFLHGFLGNAAFWRPVGEMVKSNTTNFTASYLTLPGHHESTYFSDIDAGPSPSIEKAVDWVHSHCVSDASNWIIGYSMGARLALATLLATPRQFEGAMLFSLHPGIRSGEERFVRSRWEASLMKKLKCGRMEPMVDDFEKLPIFESQSHCSAEVLLEQRKNRLNHNPSNIAQSIRLLGLSRFPVLTSKLMETDTPTLLVTGSSDTKYTEIAASFVPHNNITHQTIKDSGHNLILEQPRRCAALIEMFVQKKDRHRSVT